MLSGLLGCERNQLCLLGNLTSSKEKVEKKRSELFQRARVISPLSVEGGRSWLLCTK